MPVSRHSLSQNQSQNQFIRKRSVASHYRKVEERNFSFITAGACDYFPLSFLHFKALSDSIVMPGRGAAQPGWSVTHLGLAGQTRGPPPVRQSGSVRQKKMVAHALAGEGRLAGPGWRQLMSAARPGWSRVEGSRHLCCCGGFLPFCLGLP